MKKNKETPEQNGFKEKKGKKIEYVDDDRTVADMNVEGMPWYVKSGYDRKKAEKKLSFKEKAAIIFGAYRAYLPGFLIVCGAMVLTFLLIKILWS